MGLDFVQVTHAINKNGVTVYPKFKVGKKCTDLMIRGGDFYAVWDEQNGKWSTDEDTVIFLVDQELREYAKKFPETGDNTVSVKFMWDSDSGVIDKWHKYCQRQMRDNFHSLDEKMIFANDPVKKDDYASKRLNYALEPGSTKNWDRLMGVLYSPEELHKLEWCIGSIVTGDSKTLEKFLVLYGAGGTGKGTYLKIVKMLFGDYQSAFSAKALGQSNNQFALEPFSNNPLVAIDFDGKLDRIEDNTRLNTIISHEDMIVNEKFTRTYTNHFKAFLMVASNSPVKITDAKSGLIRRLIDARPSGNKVTQSEYNRLMKKIPYELGAIACKCRDLYLEDPEYYDNYRPEEMMGSTNEFYNYILDNSHIFEDQNNTTLKQAWELYKAYCTDANVTYPFSKIRFKEELKNYFNDFEERSRSAGKQIRNLYTGFVYAKGHVEDEEPEESWLIFDKKESILDEILSDCPAQLANEAGNPRRKWENVRQMLKDIDTHLLHYVKVPLVHIVIDFDIPDPETGEKSLALNMEAAKQWPPTYAELSKSGQGIHLHYIYSGDPNKVSSVFEEHIEIKVFKGNSSLRRMLTLCNDMNVTTLTGGLPLKGDSVTINDIQDEKHLRALVKKACVVDETGIPMEIHQHHKPNMDFIKKITDDAYQSGMSYDISDMRGSIVLGFAARSRHQSDYCLGLLDEIHWKSEDHEVSALDVVEEAPIIFYDIEVFPNLFLVNWKFAGENEPVNRMINPTSQDIEDLMQYRWIGFNNRRYDNHLMYACFQGYTVPQLYSLSQKIINGEKNAMFASAYGLSYTDVYDYCAKKQSLKKWEIELGIHHQELGLPWDKPVKEELWPKVAEYCDNDVIATEAVFNATQGDFTARKILAAIAGGSVNDSTNSLSTRFIFEGNKNPQSEFIYRFMGDESKIVNRVHEIVDAKGKSWPVNPEYTCMDDHGRPVFPGYRFEKGKSTYRGVDPGEGGYVYSEPGFHGNVALLDIASMHPTSGRKEMIFGPYFTERFGNIVDTRLMIKHKDYDGARKMFGGALKPYLEDESTAKGLAQALKIVINSVYGLTSAKFDNPARDKRNKDNIVAKRGSLFMVNLKHEVQDKGFKVAHIKTDSIKIPDATPEIIDFVMAYGKLYGYDFEHEATYERLLLKDKANYIAYDADHKYWTATGDKYARPFIFKPLFSNESLTFDDMCETKSVKTAIYLDLNEDLVDVTAEEKELKKWQTKYKKGEISDTTYEGEYKRLSKLIAKGHNYTFVGKVGNFVPIKEGCHGGLCMRINDAGTYGAVEGTKGYRWLEAEFVKENGLEDSIDSGYFKEQVDKVVMESQILPGGDFEWFRNIEDPYVGPEYGFNGAPIYEDTVPFN